MKKSKITILIWATLFILMIISAYYFNWHTDICIWFKGKCSNYYIPNLWIISISVIWSLFPILMSFYRHYIMKEIEEENSNHLKFLRTIKEKDCNFDIIYFDDYKEAEKKFNTYKNWYILPIWYLYDIWVFDNITRDNFVEKIETYNLREFTIEQLDNIESGNDDNLSYIKKFIDLEEYIERLKQKWVKTFDLKNNIIRNLFNEKFIELNSWKLLKNILVKLLKDKSVRSFVLIKWYYLLYYTN